MSSLSLVTLLGLLSLLALIDAIGFPTGGGGGGCCCGGGGGGCCVSSCGCGRKKREAVAPHFKGPEVACPQTEWRELMTEAMVADDPIASLNAIQNALYGRFGESKFLVNCAGEAQPAETTTAISAIINDEASSPTNVHFSASGDGYCNVNTGNVWCQAMALHA